MGVLAYRSIPTVSRVGMTFGPRLFEAQLGVASCALCNLCASCAVKRRWLEVWEQEGRETFSSEFSGTISFAAEWPFLHVIKGFAVVLLGTQSPRPSSSCTKPRCAIALCSSQFALRMTCAGYDSVRRRCLDKFVCCASLGEEEWCAVSSSVAGTDVVYHDFFRSHKKK